MALRYRSAVCLGPVVLLELLSGTGRGLEGYYPLGRSVRVGGR